VSVDPPPGQIVPEDFDLTVYWSKPTGPGYSVTYDGANLNVNGTLVSYVDDDSSTSHSVIHITWAPIDLNQPYGPLQITLNPPGWEGGYEDAYGNLVGTTVLTYGTP
jgi:hypothetical protein